MNIWTGAGWRQVTVVVSSVMNFRNFVNWGNVRSSWATLSFLMRRLLYSRPHLWQTLAVVHLSERNSCDTFQSNSAWSCMRNVSPLRHGKERVETIFHPSQWEVSPFAFTTTLVRLGTDCALERLMDHSQTRRKYSKNCSLSMREHLECPYRGQTLYF